MDVHFILIVFYFGLLGFIQGIFISIKEINQLLIRSPKASEVTFLFLFLRSEKKRFLGPDA